MDFLFIDGWGYFLSWFIGGRPSPAGACQEVFAAGIQAGCHQEDSPRGNNFNVFLRVDGKNRALEDGPAGRFSPHAPRFWGIFLRAAYAFRRKKSAFRFAAREIRGHNAEISAKPFS
jgi:hypothetical protein